MIGASQMVFVGRQREMGEMEACLQDAIGQGRLVMLVGEPGIGKTHIAEELATYAETQGAQAPISGGGFSSGCRSGD